MKGDLRLGVEGQAARSRIRPSIMNICSMVYFNTEFVLSSLADAFANTTL